MTLAASDTGLSHESASGTPLIAPAGLTAARTGCSEREAQKGTACAPFPAQLRLSASPAASVQACWAGAGQPAARLCPRRAQHSRCCEGGWARRVDLPAGAAGSRPTHLPTLMLHILPPLACPMGTPREGFWWAESHGLQHSSPTHPWLSGWPGCPRWRRSASQKSLPLHSQAPE